MLRKICTLLAFCLCVMTFAQEPINFTTKDGLPSNHIYDIQEDANGFMWFATNRGLVNFDGETFKTFTIKDGLPNNDTWLLDLDYKGRLWYFSKSSYQGYIKNDSIYKFQTEDKKVISPTAISKSKDSLWFNSQGTKTLKGNKFKNISITKNKTDAEIRDTISKIQRAYNFEKNSTFYFTNPVTNETVFITADKQLYFDKNFKLVQEKSQILPKQIERLKTNSSGMLYNQIAYFGCDDGLIFLDFKKKKIKFFNLKQLTGKESFAYLKVKGLKDEIQVSISDNLLIFNYNLELIKKYIFDTIDNNGSYKDSKGNIWLKDFSSGISLLPITQLASQYYLKNKKVQKINYVEDNFYAGVNNDGFYIKNNKNKRFYHFMKFDKSNGEIYGIRNNILKNEIVFISAANSFRYKNGAIKPFSFPKGNYFDSPWTSAFKDVDAFEDTYYFTTSFNVLVSKLKNKSELVYEKEGLSKSVVFNKQLYFGGTDGLHTLKDTIVFNQKKKNELLTVSVSSFLPSKEYLFVGTDGRGLYLYKESEVIHLIHTDGFSVQKIIKKGNKLWLATQKGVHQITINYDDITSSKITNSFYEADGLLQNNTNDIFLKKDTLFAASDTGLAKLNVNSSLYKNKPKIYFKSKKDTFHYKNKARGNISINFALQDFINQEYTTYQYRLLPSQKEWTSTSTKTLNFINLSPTSYTLEVKATDQHFNQSIKKSYFHVIPAWWQTTLSKIGFGILALLLFILIIVFIKNRIHNKVAAKAEVEKKMAGLELQALRSQMNPHFVHNSLNAIQYFIQRNEVELSEDYLVKFSKLVRLFFEYSRKQTLTIEEEVTLLENYLQIEKLRFEEKLSYSINIDKKIDKEELQIPSMLLQPILENAVNHGLFHKKENGLVTVDFKYIDYNTYKVTIKDNGIGIKKAKEFYKNSVKNYQSSSTIVLQERLSLLQKSKHWEIEYSIEDLSKTNKGEQGTEVNISFKKNI